MITFGWKSHEGNEWFPRFETRWKLDRHGLVDQCRSFSRTTGAWSRWVDNRGIVRIPKPPMWGYDCFWYDGPHPTLCLGLVTVFWQWHDTKDGHCEKCRDTYEEDAPA